MGAHGHITGMSNVTSQPSPAPRRLTALPDAPDLLAMLNEWHAALREHESTHAVLAARLDGIETRLIAVTPQATLDLYAQQITAARNGLAENLKWLELSVKLMTRARDLLSEMGLSETDEIAGALPTPANVSAALASTSPQGAAQGESTEVALQRLLAGFGIKL